MYDVFSKYEVEEVIKKWKVKTYRLLGFIMVGVGLFIALEYVIIAFLIEEEAEVAIYWLLPFALMMFLIGFVSIQQGKKVSSHQKEVLEATLINEYQTVKTKIPILKRTQSNKNNSEVAVMLLMDKDKIDVVRLNKSLKIISTYETKDAVFKFDIDTKKGLEKISRKFYIEYHKRNYKFYMMQETEYKIMNFITSNGYHYEIYENNILKKHYR